MASDQMKSISITKFKSECSGSINFVYRSGESILITKRGKPVAVLAPVPANDDRLFVPGRCEDTIKIVGDILSPVEVEWEALGDLHNRSCSYLD